MVMKQLYVSHVLIIYDLTWCELTFSLYLIWLDLSKIMIFVKKKKVPCLVTTSLTKIKLINPNSTLLEYKINLICTSPKLDQLSLYKNLR